jgi:glycosyltransferase involved in cell wall biosynthesis
VPEARDAEALYARARVFVEATRTGGGTKLKVLNALARGLPVVASPEGVAGLDARPGEHLLVADGDLPFADAVLQALTDEAAWTQLSEAGRGLIRAEYRADVAFAPLSAALGGVATGG